MREVPAALIWVGVDPSNFTNDQNWYDYTAGSGGVPVPIPGTVLQDEDDDTHFWKTPTAEDDLYFVGPQDRLPDGIYLPEVLRRSWSINPDAHATVPESLSTLQSLHLVDHYTGTVSTRDNQHPDTLELRIGSIGQLGAADGVNALVVTESFQFTGGTLNNTSTTGVVHLLDLDVDGVIGLGNATVTTGTTLSVESGTTLQYGNGKIGFANEATLHMFAGSFVRPQSLDGTQLGQFINANPVPGAVQKPMVVEGSTFIAKLSRTQGITVEATGRLEIIAM